jgi:uncharacterized integral membrane protein
VFCTSADTTWADKVVGVIAGSAPAGIRIVGIVIARIVDVTNILTLLLIAVSVCRKELVNFMNPFHNTLDLWAKLFNGQYRFRFIVNNAVKRALEQDLLQRRDNCYFPW